jgi:Domain of unknown function (DUF4397)
MKKSMKVMFIALVVALMPMTVALAQSDEGQVIVVHGVPDLDVDIYVNGDLTLEGFKYGDVAGPLALPAGTYDVEVYAAGSDPEAGDPALSGSTDLPAGAVATIAAYLEEGGTPTLGVFVENNSAIEAGNARISAYHLADFGAVDVLVNDDPVWEGVTNGNGANADVPADTYNVKITAAGDPATVAFDADVDLTEGTNTIAYAIGSVADGNFQVVTAAITGLGSAPEGVPTGDAGLSTDSNAMLPIAIGAFALLSIAAGAVTLARRENG